MNKIYKVIGVSALIVTLICNLQYSLFFNVKNSPNAAKASWMSVNMYGTTVIYCGSSPSTVLKAGIWFWVAPGAYNFNSYVNSTNPYQYGYYYFVPGGGGSQCGLNQPSANTNFRQDHIWEITAPGVPFASSY